MQSIAGLSRRAVATAEGMAPVLDFHFRSRYGEPARRARDLRLHLRQSARDAAAGPGRGDPRPRGAARQGLVRLQDQRARARRPFSPSALGRELGLPFEPADIALTAGPSAPSRSRSSLLLDAGDEVDLLRAALVLLRADAARRRRGAAQGRPDADRPSTSTSPRSRRRSARARGWSSSTRRTTRPAASTAARRWRRWRTCSSAPRRGSATASSCCPTSPTGACASTAGASSARRRSTPGRSSPTATARCCSPRASGSAIWRSRR